MSGGKRKSKGKERMTNIFTLLVPQGEYVEGGGLMGFAYGYFLKKILKAAILILEGHGEMKGLLTLHWRTLKCKQMLGSNNRSSN